jgi:rhodanese-related sulfurtransferase
MALLVVLGSALGIGYNALGLQAKARWGLAWIGRDRLAELAATATVVAAPSARGHEAQDPYVTQTSDPRAIVALAGAALPEIPATDSPVQIERQALSQYVDARAALVLDAREAHEYEAGHLPGAVSLPYDQVATDGQRLAQLEAGGRPIVVYCGGGTCELSLDLAWDLIYAGHTRVAVYMGGYPDWVAAGLPVETGSAP